MKTQVTQFSTDDVKPGKMIATFLGRKGPVASPNGMMIFWEFQVTQDGEPLVVTGVSSDSFSYDSRCKAMKWARLIDPLLSEEVSVWDDEQAVGITIGAEVIYRESGDQLISTVKSLFIWPHTNPAT